jgi:hypothetical protein
MDPLRARRLAIRILTILVLAAAGTLALWACGPFFPNWLTGDEASVLDAAALPLRQEIKRLLLKAPFESVPPAEGDPFAQTAAADLADLRKALERDGMAAAPRQALVDQYSRIRTRLSEHAASAGPFREVGDPPRSSEDGEPPAPPVPLPPGLRVPAGVPGEFADYLEGAIAYHQERYDAARSAWERLLQRPEDQRRWRSTWAAFMLGKTALRQGDPQAAVRWFERTRELAGQKMEDSLGLAAATLGWEARAELRQGHYDKALVLYARHAESGDPLALSSLQHASREALKAGPNALVPVARSPESRGALTAFLAWRHDAPWGSQYGDGEDGGGGAAGAPDPDVARWLAAVKAAGVNKDVRGAERLAWVAYQGADYAAAQEWLKLAPEHDGLTSWVRAKLLLRDGKLAQAEELLAQAAGRILPAKLTEEEADRYRPWGTGGRIATGPLASGEEGSVLTTLGRYPEALHAYLRGGFWLDAAYLAERVLTLDELKEYVDEHWPASRTGNDSPDWFEGVARPDPLGVAHDIRYLLGRRLARAGRLREAAAYLPAASQPWIASLDKNLAEGRDAGKPASDRARALFEAACVTRHYGLALLGTEIDPDWRIYDGQYEMSFPMSFAERRKNKHLVPGPDEEAREKKNRLDPFLRFHYRYKAADLAWEAAALLPDGSDSKAETLATAGTWLKNRSAGSASRFYKELTRCCSNTDLGRAATEKKLIPDVEACPHQ